MKIKEIRELTTEELLNKIEELRMEDEEGISNWIFATLAICQKVLGKNKEFCNQIGKNAYSTAIKYSLQNTIKSYENYYEKKELEKILTHKSEKSINKRRIYSVEQHAKNPNSVLLFVFIYCQCKLNADKISTNY